MAFAQERGWHASGAYEFFHETYLSKFFNKVWFEQNEQKIFFLGEDGKEPQYLSPGRPVDPMKISEADLHGNEVNSTLHPDDMENPGGGDGETGGTESGGTGGADDPEAPGTSTTGEGSSTTGGTGGSGTSDVAGGKKKVNMAAHVLPAGPAPAEMALMAGPPAQATPGQAGQWGVMRNNDAYSLHPSLRGKVITLAKEDTLHHAIETLSKYEILSAPVIDNKGINVGFIEIFDIIRYFVQDFDAEGKQNGVNRLDASCGEVITFSLRKPVEMPISVRLSNVAPIFAAGEHRMAVLNKRREDGGRFIGIFSQSDLLKYAAPEFRPSGRLQSLGVYSVENMMHEVTTVKMTDSVMSTLRKMIDKDDRSVCVVGDNGAIVGDFAASDFRGFTANDFDNFKANSWSVGVYLKTHGSLARAKALDTVKRHQSLYEVLSLMLKQKLHHIYVADAENRPIGVVDLRDIILFCIEFTPVVEIRCCGLTMSHLKWLLQGLGVICFIIALYLLGTGSTIGGVSVICVAVVLIGIGVYIHFRYTKQKDPLNDLKEMIKRNLESRHNDQGVLDKFDALAPEVGVTPALTDPGQQHEYGLTREQIDHFAKVWSEFDAAGRGYITADDLHDYMLKQGRATNAHEIGEFIRAFDLNGDGFVTFQEFLMVHSALLNKDPDRGVDVNDTALPGAEEDDGTNHTGGGGTHETGEGAGEGGGDDDEEEEDGAEIEYEEEIPLGRGNPLGLGPAPEQVKRKRKKKIKTKKVRKEQPAIVAADPEKPGEIVVVAAAPAVVAPASPDGHERENSLSRRSREPSVSRRENSQNRRENSQNRRENSLNRRENSVKQSPKLKSMRSAQKLVDEMEKQWDIKSESRYEQPSVHVYNSVRGGGAPGTVRGTIREQKERQEDRGGGGGKKRPHKSKGKQRPALPADFNGAPAAQQMDNNDEDRVRSAFAGVGGDSKESSVVGGDRDRDFSRNSRAGDNDGEAESVMGDDDAVSNGGDSRRSSINSLSSAHAISPFLAQATQAQTIAGRQAQMANNKAMQQQAQAAHNRDHSQRDMKEVSVSSRREHSKNSLSGNSSPRTPKSRVTLATQAAAGQDPRSRADQRSTSAMVIHHPTPPLHPKDRDVKDEEPEVVGTGTEGTEADPGVNIYPTQLEGGAKAEMSSPRHRALSKDDVDLAYEQKRERELERRDIQMQPGVMGWCSLDCGQIGVHRLRCAHVLCQNCSEKWSRNGQCPLCRTNAMMLTLEITPDNMSTTGVREKSPPSVNNRGSFALASASSAPNPNPEGQVSNAPGGAAAAAAGDDGTPTQSPIRHSRHPTTLRPSLKHAEGPLNYNRTLKKNPSRRSMQV